MIPSSFGDVARSLTLTRQSANLKIKMSALSQEMTTGLAHDKARRLGGNFHLLAGIEEALEKAMVRKSLSQSAMNILTAQQSIIDDISSQMDRAVAQLMVVESSADAPALDRSLSGIGEMFDDILRALNTSVAGRTIFAGRAGDQPAVAQVDQIMASLIAELPLPTDATALSEFVDTWFSPGGGFETTAYLGSSAIPASLQIGPGLSVGLSVTATDPALRQTLAGLAKAKLFVSTKPDASIEEKRSILGASLADLLRSKRSLIELSTRLGQEEESATAGQVRAEAEISSLSIARAEMLSVDPYKAASELEQTIAQLDTIYAITARMSRLSLANFLR